MTKPLPTLLPGAEPFFYRGGPVGCLCLHGFMASPAEVRWFGQHLAAQSFTVCGPRLAGHGTNPRDMARQRWQDWYAGALDGYHLLRGCCEKVFVAGLSMGGALALLLGAGLPVDGLVVLAAPAQFTDWRMTYAHLIRYALPYTDQGDSTDLPQIIREEQARRGEPVLGRVRYDRWSSAAVVQLYRLVEAARSRLPDVTAPLLLVYSEADETVPLDNQALIAGQVGSAVVERHILRRSGHILTQDVERETVFKLAADFIAAQAACPQP